MAAIDIGSPAILRATDTVAGKTYILQENPANLSGTIDTIQVYAHLNCNGFEAATFYNISGTNFSTRDSEYIGAVTAGSTQTFSGLNMDVVAGDYIGFYCGSEGDVYRTDSGVGWWDDAGDQIPASNHTFFGCGNRTLSLYGTGSTPAVAAGGSNAAKLIGAGLL